MRQLHDLLARDLPVYFAPRKEGAPLLVEMKILFLRVSALRRLDSIRLPVGRNCDALRFCQTLQPVEIHFTPPRFSEWQQPIELCWAAVKIEVDSKWVRAVDGSAGSGEIPGQSWAKSFPFVANYGAKSWASFECTTVSRGRQVQLK
jgi:hypothetical protein